MVAANCTFSTSSDAVVGVLGKLENALLDRSTRSLCAMAPDPATTCSPPDAQSVILVSSHCSAQSVDTAMMTVLRATTCSLSTPAQSVVLSGSAQSAVLVAMVVLRDALTPLHHVIPYTQHGRMLLELT